MKFIKKIFSRVFRDFLNNSFRDFIYDFFSWTSAQLLYGFHQVFCMRFLLRGFSPLLKRFFLPSILSRTPASRIAPGILSKISAEIYLDNPTEILLGIHAKIPACITYNILPRVSPVVPPGIWFMIFSGILAEFAAAVPLRILPDILPRLPIESSLQISALGHFERILSGILFGILY